MGEAKLRAIIAGQLPPPIGGQNLMIQKALAQFNRSPFFCTEHLPFRFTPYLAATRQGGVKKLGELVRVIGRLLHLRVTGPIDLLLYPSGGPQNVPLLRDLLLFPWMLLFSRRVIVHFHAAGIGDRLGGILPRLVGWLYSKAYAAIVNSDYNRSDPASVGIKRTIVVPCRIDDEFDPELIRRNGVGKIRLLALGHLCADKGTPALLEAHASVCKQFPELELELAGECLPPFTSVELDRLLDQFQIRSQVSLPGLLTGRSKAEAFGRAHLFVFPTIAPYESFGLVLAEAMSWQLPIVATNWRGNADVLTAKAGAICFRVSSNLTKDIEAALLQALRQREQWTEWGKINRAIFEKRYCEADDPEWLVRPMLSLVRDDPVAMGTSSGLPNNSDCK